MCVGGLLFQDDAIMSRLIPVEAGTGGCQELQLLDTHRNTHTVGQSAENLRASANRRSRDHDK